MLLEALVALGLILAFAAALGPLLFQARQIMRDADDRIAAHALLRSLLDVPLDRAAFAKGPKEGESAGLRWRITATLMHVYTAGPPRNDSLSVVNSNGPAPANVNAPVGQPANPQVNQPQPVDWTAYRVVASVFWGNDHTISAETVRLGSEQ